MALPIPCMTLNTIRKVPDGDIAQKMELTDSTIFPHIKTRLRPIISASFPIGTKNTADESNTDMVTQLMVTAFMWYKLLIIGRARFTLVPINGVINEVIITSTRIKDFSFELGMIIFVLNNKIWGIVEKVSI